jgi:SAM-dependent methyltransferase
VELSAYLEAQHLVGRHGFAAFDWAARDLVGAIDLTGHALEIGAGSGLLSLWLLHRGAASVTLLEPESDGGTTGVSARAQQHRRALGVPEDRWTLHPRRLQDFETDRRFGLIVARASINHLDEEACIRLHEDATARARYLVLFEKIRDLLTDGGSFVMSDCARVNYWDKVASRPSPWAPEIEWHKHQEPETWSRLLAEAGLGGIRRRWVHSFYRSRHFSPLISNRFAARCLASTFVISASRGSG